MQWGNDRYERRFAQGEVIPFKYTEISYAGKTPTSEEGLAFRLTIQNRTTQEILIHQQSPEVAAIVFEGNVVVSGEIQTNTLPELTELVADFWVEDPETGRHRLDHYILYLDQPRTPFN